MNIGNYKIFIADDDVAIRETVTEVLMSEGYLVTVYDPADPDDSLLQEQYDIAILDMVMPGTDGFTLRTEILKHSPGTQFIFITGFPDREKLEKAMDLGVFTFLTKPFTADHIRFAVLGALRVKDILRENLEKAALGTESMGFIGKSQAMVLVRRKILQLAPLDLPILITGESGTGKEIIARSIQQYSHRASKQFTVVNCAGLSPGLIESELFGHVQGAFTGATKTKHGFFEFSDGGTLFLDEIGDLSFELQSRFLRVLDCGEIHRVGETVTRKVDVRIISATNRDLKEMVREKRFREDLYYRLHGSQIHISALRERRDDIPALVRYFLGDEKMVVTPDALDMLQKYDWPGNVRELRMIIENLKGISQNRIIIKEAVANILGIEKDCSGNVSSILTYKEFKQKVLMNSEKSYFESLLQSTRGNISKAAKLAGIDRKNLYDKLKQLGISY